MGTDYDKFLAEEIVEQAREQYNKGDHAETVRLLLKANGLDPLNEASINGLAYFCLRPQKELDKLNITPPLVRRIAGAMHAMITQASATREVPCRYHVTCAQLHYKTSDYRMCYYYYSHARRQEPGNPEYPVRMAEILKNNKRYIDAITLCNQAIEADPTYAYAYFMLGLVNIAVEAYAKAIEAFETFVALAPSEDTNAKNIRKILEDIRADQENAGKEPNAVKRERAVQTELLPTGKAEQLSLFE